MGDDQQGFEADGTHHSQRGLSRQNNIIRYGYHEFGYVRTGLHDALATALFDGNRPPRPQRH